MGTIFYRTTHILVLAICAILSSLRPVSVTEVRAAPPVLPLLDSPENDKTPHEGVHHRGEERHSFTLYVKRDAQIAHHDDDTGWTLLTVPAPITDSRTAFGERIWFLQRSGLLTKLLGEQLDEGIKLRLCKRGRLLLPGNGCSETFMFRNGRWMREVDGQSPLEQGLRDYTIPLLSKEEMANNQRARLLRLIGNTQRNKVLGIFDHLSIKESDIKIGPTTAYL